MESEYLVYSDNGHGVVVFEESYKIEDEIRNWQFESEITDDRIISVQENKRDGIYEIIIYYKGT